MSWVVLWVLHPDLGEFYLLGSQNDARRALALAVVDRDAAKRGPGYALGLACSLVLLVGGIAGMLRAF